jgi:hypothetical protein
VKGFRFLNGADFALPADVAVAIKRMPTSVLSKLKADR